MLKKLGDDLLVFNGDDMSNNSYLILNKNNKALLIDPSSHGKEINQYLTDNKIELLAILLTHGHYDHISSINEFNCDVYLGNLDVIKNYNCANYFNLKNFEIKNIKNYHEIKNDVLNIDNFKIKVYLTPGHTSDGVCYKYKNYCFSGDTLFSNSVGRWDLPTANKEQLFKSLRNIIKWFDNEYLILPGHNSEYLKFKEVKKNNNFIIHFMNDHE